MMRNFRFGLMAAFLWSFCVALLLITIFPSALVNGSPERQTLRDEDQNETSQIVSSANTLSNKVANILNTLLVQGLPTTVQQGENSLFMPSVKVPGLAETPSGASDETPTSVPTIILTPISTPVPDETPIATPTATPTTTTGGSSWWQPTSDKPIAWHWQLSQEFVYPRDVIPGVTVYDIDGELTSAETVAQLHALGPEVKVICYIDAGVFEDYRSDAASFPPEVIGDADVGWEGSYWLDIRRIDILKPIMENRIKNWCKAKGFDAVEPDETEVWSNDSGFDISKEENNAYNIMIAELAHQYGLSVGLKGNTTEAGELVDYFDWTLNEQCWEYDECDQIYDSFIVQGKAAFNIEYDAEPNCVQANQWHLNSAQRDLDLVGPTQQSYRFDPCIPYEKNTWD